MARRASHGTAGAGNVPLAVARGGARFLSVPPTVPSPAPESARAFWIEAPFRGALRVEPLAAPRAGEARVRTLWSGISRGTERLVWRGEVPPALHEVMRAPFQAGAFPGPVKYGYAAVGRVEDGPADLLGRTVFCLHPHQTDFVVDAAALVPVPETVPPARAVLAANMETALNGVWDAGIGPGDRVAVIGAGAVGCMAAWLAARVPGTVVTLADIDPSKAAVAAALGVAFAHPDALAEGQDAVIHASGAGAALARALAIAGDEAVIAELSWYGTEAVSLPLGLAFHPRRLTVRSSQVGQLPPARRPRWTHRRRLETAIALLADPRLDALVTEDTPFDTLPERFARLDAAPAGEICVRVAYDPDHRQPA
jgi:threonine dehydrogenase-like Zn-dependent dehydrogenase